MSEETTNIPQDGTVTTPQAQAPALTVADLRNVRAIIDLSSSRGAFRGEPNAPAYGASKAGLNSLGQSMAVALAKDNIFVYTLAPGYVDTDRVKNLIDDGVKSQSPLNRVATPEEVAKTALWLAMEKNQFLTGSIIDINGASYLRS